MTLPRVTIICLLFAVVPGLQAQRPGQPPIEACKPGDFTVIGFPNEFGPQPDSSFDVFVDQGFLDKFLIAGFDWSPAIRQSIDRWNNLPGSEWLFTDRGITSEPASFFDQATTIAPCGPGFFCIEPPDPPVSTDPPFDPTAPPSGQVAAHQFALAVTLSTTLNRGDRAIADADVFFNALSPFSTTPAGNQIDFESVLVHELGHVIGLNHNDNCASLPTVMESLIDFGEVGRDLSDPEREAAKFLYPDSSSPGVTVFSRDRVLNFEGRAGQSALRPRAVRIFGPNAKRWEATAATSGGGDWVRVNPPSGTFGTDDVAEIIVDPSELGTGDFSATISFRRPSHNGPATDVAVQLQTTEIDGDGRPLLTRAGIVNGSNNLSQNLAPGSLFTLFGQQLADFGEVATSTPLPTSLGGAEVLVNAVPAPLLFASPTQINGQIPPGTFTGRGGVIVRTAAGQTDSVPMDLTAAAPELFLMGDQAIALNQDGSVNSPSNPAAGGSLAVIFFSGIGAVDPPVAAGRAAPVRPLSRAVLPASVRIGGQEVEIAFLGLTPTFVALSQANVEIPAGLSGKLAVVITIDGHGSTLGFIYVQ